MSFVVEREEPVFTDSKSVDFPLAHVKQNENGNWKKHSLEEHLIEVAKLAGKMAEKFGSSDWTYLAGLWHDLGKYNPEFQSYIKRASGYDPDAHIEGSNNHPEHSSAGALYAIEQLGKIGLVLAYLIAGHHTGLPNYNGSASALESRLKNCEDKQYLKKSLAHSLPASILSFTKPVLRPVSKPIHLWIRMLFSCLVDADFLDTEAFMSPERLDQRSLSLVTLNNLKKLFDTYMSHKLLGAIPSAVNSIRKKILDDCRKAASSSPGIFTLTVPTGGGKTLSGMAFALEHAIKYNKSRIIVVIPYTSIIEQTADQYRAIFGDVIIEHHSNIDPEQEDSKSRLACENWDAPIIVTTNVQFLESLFAAKPSRCRKLHNISNSVVIMDEAQLLPPNFLKPAVEVLDALTKFYGVTLVLSTATQPALKTKKDFFGRTVFNGFDNPKEIISDVAGLYKSLNRVTVQKPIDFHRRCTWQELANELLNYPSVLVIVNSRKDSKSLFDLMPKGTYYLSGLMCGQHRSEVIAEIKKRREAGEAVRVVSTQLVEAGVDFDFPVVYRALSGLDSIAQAAGRCNREGKLLQGKMVVFIPPNQSPSGMLTFAEQATKKLWYDLITDPIHYELFPRYFDQYFSQCNLDNKDIFDLLNKDERSFQFQFRSAAEKFKIIDDAKMKSILVSYNEEAEELVKLLENQGMECYLMRKLQRYVVTVYPKDFNELNKIGALKQIQLGIWVVDITNGYDKTCGLLRFEELYSDDPERCVI